MVGLGDVESEVGELALDLAGEEREVSALRVGVLGEQHVFAGGNRREDVVVAHFAGDQYIRIGVGEDAVSGAGTKRYPTRGSIGGAGNPQCGETEVDAELLGEAFDRKRIG